MKRGTTSSLTSPKTTGEGSYTSSLLIPNSKRINWALLLLTYAPPLLAGGVAFFFGWQVSNVSDFIAGVAVIAGFLFALLIFVFQLRLQVSHDPRIQQRIRVPVLIDELFGTALVATAVAVAFTVLLIVSAGTSGVDDSGVDLPLSKLWSAVIIAVGSYLCTLLLVVGAKTRAAYKTAANGTEISA